jgi:hypothetical protein
VHCEEVWTGHRGLDGTDLTMIRQREPANEVIADIVSKIPVMLAWRRIDLPPSATEL